MEIFIILLGIAADRLTKVWIMQNLSENSHMDVVSNLVSLLYIKNKGAAFGILQNKLYLLAAITIVVIIGMIYYIFKFKPQSKIIKISLSLIISGALGNLIDRILYKYVVDFIAFHLGDIYYFPIFNIADILVVTGTIALAFYLLKEEKYEN
ncbi:signal peptidase II [Clostridium kluyveri]|uniref:Lipoprotein signal peptidase n=1 Tax=Clostridium kluyveri TaxID=1534 RepID=A0A1L5F6H5_CLOKL|nr:signal peptidase II [Clostridium kluyveri]APM38583.1 signal peptidase II [Clostridium kluyveri]UZQ50882.1 signal peptidase II [Clostridium kluyveri]